MKFNSLLISCVIATGMIAAAAVLSSGIKQIAFKDRAVTVKGLATADVKADYAVYPIYYTIESNDMRSLQAEATRVKKEVMDILLAKGFTKADLKDGKVSVSDQWANYYGERRPAYQYSLDASVVISTEKVDLVAENLNLTSELLDKGILVNIQEWSIDYQYNGLADIKPAMIEEATANARAVAIKFAEDAKCKLGSIRRANQGQFTIESDEYQPWIKHIRVVTTVDYYLK